ncbi:MAG: ferritin family protein [Nitrospirae bacterium]|nr:ferritin family protein [Nitrospirota bacterium]
MSALQTAAKMESDAIKFYREASEKTKNAVGKKMFLSIVEDEKRHLEIINKLINKNEFSASDASAPMKSINTVFESMKNEMLQRAEASSDELEAFKIAMEMEREGKEFYKQSAAGAASDKEKELFNLLASEEEEHYTIFANTYNFLKDSGNWFMWEEKGIVEG